MSIGVPIKVLHEAEGHIVTVETTSGEVRIMQDSLLLNIIAYAMSSIHYKKPACSYCSSKFSYIFGVSNLHCHLFS